MVAALFEEMKDVRRGGRLVVRPATWNFGAHGVSGRVVCMGKSGHMHAVESGNLEGQGVEDLVRERRMTNTASAA